MTFSVLSLSLIKSGPAKSSPVFVKGGSSLTLLGGSGGNFVEEKVFPSSRLQVTHFFRTGFTDSCPPKIQKVLRRQFNVSFILQ